LTYSDEVIRYDPRVRHVSRDESEGGVVAQIAADDAGAWILTPSETGGSLEGRVAELFRFDAATSGFVGTPTVIGGGYAALAARRGDVWVARAGGVVQIASDDSIASVTPANVGVPSGVAIDDDGIVWVADSSGGRVLRVDPKSKDVKAIRLGQRPDGIAAAEGKIWVTVY
jgi:NHL repeat